MALTLTTAHGYNENPPVIRQMASEAQRVDILQAHSREIEPRIQERSALLMKAFTDSGLQRLCRKAGIEQAATSEKTSAYHSLRMVADTILFNILKRCVILAEHRRKLSITELDVEHVLKEDLGYTSYSSPGPEPLPACPTLGSEGLPSGAKRARGKLAEREIKHEEKASTVHISKRRRSFGDCEI